MQSFFFVKLENKTERNVRCLRVFRKGHRRFFAFLFAVSLNDVMLCARITVSSTSLWCKCTLYDKYNPLWFIRSSCAMLRYQLKTDGRLFSTVQNICRVFNGPMGVCAWNILHLSSVACGHSVTCRWRYQHSAARSTIAIVASELRMFRACAVAALLAKARTPIFVLSRWKAVWLALQSSPPLQVHAISYED